MKPLSSTSSTQQKVLKLLGLEKLMVWQNTLSMSIKTLVEKYVWVTLTYWYTKICFVLSVLPSPRSTKKHVALWSYNMMVHNIKYAVTMVYSYKACTYHVSSLYTKFLTLWVINVSSPYQFDSVGISASWLLPTTLIVLLDVMKPFPVECFTAVIHPLCRIQPHSGRTQSTNCPLIDQAKKTVSSVCCLHKKV